MFENLLSRAQGLLGDATAENVAAAARDHVNETDPNELTDHLQESAKAMQPAMRGGLAATLLNALAQHGQDENAVQAASGVDTSAAKSGDLGAIVGLIEHAGTNPQALRDAAVQYVQANPQAVMQFAPPFVQGILGKLSGRG